MSEDKKRVSIWGSYTRRPINGFRPRVYISKDVTEATFPGLKNLKDEIGAQQITTDSRSANTFIVLYKNQQQ